MLVYSPFHWALEEFRLREIEVIVENVANQDEVFVIWKIRRGFSSNGIFFKRLTIWMTRCCMRYSKLMSRRSSDKKYAGYTPRLTLPEPDTGLDKSLVWKPKKQCEKWFFSCPVYWSTSCLLFITLSLHNYFNLVMPRPSFSYSFSWQQWTWAVICPFFWHTASKRLNFVHSVKKQKRAATDYQRFEYSAARRRWTPTSCIIQISWRNGSKQNEMHVVTPI